MKNKVILHAINSWDEYVKQIGEIAHSYDSHGRKIFSKGCIFRGHSKP